VANEDYDIEVILKASAELAQTKAELKRATEEHSHLVKEFEDWDTVIEEEREGLTSWSKPLTTTGHSR
jgi:hypothetical protein